MKQRVAHFLINYKVFKMNIPQENNYTYVETADDFKEPLLNK